MPETRIVTVGQWAVAIDGVQWILQKRAGAGWRPVSFVRSTKAILARCMRENGVEPEVAEKLLASLPDYCDTAFADGVIPDVHTADFRRWGARDKASPKKPLYAGAGAGAGEN